MLEAFKRNIATGVYLAAGFVQSFALIFEPAFSGEGHLLHLYRVEPRNPADRRVGRNRLRTVQHRVNLDFDFGEPGIDPRTERVLSRLIHE
jgi:hypothetical protein